MRDGVGRRSVQLGITGLRPTVETCMYKRFQFGSVRKAMKRTLWKGEQNAVLQFSGRHVSESLVFLLPLIWNIPNERTARSMVCLHQIFVGT